VEPAQATAAARDLDFFGLDPFHHSLSRFFDDYRQFPSGFVAPVPADESKPRIEMRECNDRVTITVHLPAEARNDAKVEVEDGMLSVDVSYVTDTGGTKTSGSFTQAMSLPLGLDESRMTTKQTDDGILIEIPKRYRH